MTATLDDVTKKKDKPEPTTEEKVAEELVRRAREQGLSLTGPDGPLHLDLPLRRRRSGSDRGMPSLVPCTGRGRRVVARLGSGLSEELVFGV